MKVSTGRVVVLWPGWYLGRTMDLHESAHGSPGGRIRATRQAHGQSLRGLEALDPKRFERGRWSRIERGLHGLSVEDLYAFARVVGLRDVAKAVRPFVKAKDG